MPAEGDERLESMPSTIEEIRSALLDAFDRLHQIDVAAQLVMRHLTLGHPPELIISALARALLLSNQLQRRSDANVLRAHRAADPGNWSSAYVHP